MSTFRELANNAALMLALAAFFGVLARHLAPDSLRGQLANGVLFGVVAVIGMSMPVHLMPGVVFDARSVVISLAGLYGGPYTVLISGVAAVAYRLYLGGSGVLVGSLVIATAGGIGVLFHRLRYQGRFRTGPAGLLVFGITVHVCSLLWMLILPEATRGTVLQQISLPFLVVLPVATVPFGLLLELVSSREEAERSLVSTFEQVAVGMAHVSISGQWLRVNQKLCDIVGYSRQELLALTFQDITYGEDLDTDLDHVRAVLAGEIDTYSMEKRYVRKDGSLVWINLTVSLLRRADGRPVHFIAVIEDIDAKKRMESDLARERQALHLLFHVNELLVHLRSEQELLEQVCRAVVERGGYRMAWIAEAKSDARKTVEPLAQHGFDRGYLGNLKLTWADEPAGSGPTGTAIRTATPAIMQDILNDPSYTRWRDQAIQRGYASSCAIPLRLGKEVIGALNVYSEKPHAFEKHDVELLERLADDVAVGLATLRDRADLLESESRFRDMADHSPIVLWIADAGGRMAYFNRRWSDVTGLPVAPVLGTGWLDVVHPADRTLLREALAASIRDKKGLELEFRLRTASGERSWILASASPRLDANGQFRGLIGSLVDITARKEAEQVVIAARDQFEHQVAQRTRELKRANESLKELDRLKSLFIASMSHELRTPLNSIIGFTGLMLMEPEGSLSDEHRDYLRRVEASGLHLLDLVTDVIDVSKIEAGQVDVFFERFSLRDLVQQAVDVITPLAITKGMGLNVDVLDLEIHSDRKRLMQCLVNLLSNAVKYADSGPIRVDGKLDQARIVLSVTDRGPGLQPDDLPRLFQQFTRIDSPTTRTVPGTGLGLYLTKKLMRDVLGGDVQVHSKPGEGSTFTLILPEEAHRNARAGD